MFKKDRLFRAWLLFVFIGTSTALADTEAPPVKPFPSPWSSGIKQIFGTAYEAYDSANKYSANSPTAPLSKVWFTGAQGVLTEVYWPTLDTPQIRDSEFLVTDSTGFLFQERIDSISQVEWLSTGVPAFRIRNHDSNNRFEIEKTFYTDPDRASLIERVKITKNIPGLKFYVVHNPSVSSTPLGNSALASINKGPGMGLFAWQGQQAQALISSLPFRKVSAGFAGYTDGLSDLRDNFKMDYQYDYARNGDVVLTGELEISPELGVSQFDIVLSFAPTIGEAYTTAKETLSSSLDGLLEKYTSQWQSYQLTVRDLSPGSSDGGKLFRASVAIMKSMEDKSFEGAFVASPTIPWGLNNLDSNVQVRPGESRNRLATGYHLVWPRDLFQMATSFMAIDDYHSAIASLQYLKRIQYGPSSGPNWNFENIKVHSRDGSFPQNVWINGEEGWGSLQMDEAAMPIILIYRLAKAGKIKISDYWDMAKRAADFVADFGPWTPQERWEENSGVSPSTVAAEIAAMNCASEIAQMLGDSVRATRYKSVAVSWDSKPNDNIDTWLFTTSGSHGNGRYYERMEGTNRLDQAWNPNDDAPMILHNGAGTKKEKDILDVGFLELVRFGVRQALNQNILDTVVAYDQTIRKDLPGVGAPSFYRYNFDGYNFDEVSGARTHGMLWPIFTGERAQYELEKSLELEQSPAEVDQHLNPYVHAMECFANKSFMLPEQIWDSGARMGQSTGSATPLGWSHGEYIKLLRSRLDQKVFDKLQFDF